jgi:glycosyltransferase involved in cell wall biosynthesis
LIISYAFPPAAYVGVYRTLKYCKYLGKYGWHATVVTPNTKIDKRYKNLELLDEVPNETLVFRTWDIDPIKWFQNADNWFLSKIKSLINIVCKATCIFDNHIFWVPFAYFKCRKIITHNKIDLIYSSSPPHSVHMIPYLLNKFHGQKYIIDFRDPWGDYSYDRYSNSNSYKKRLEGYFIRLIIKNANKVLTITSGEAQETREMYSIPDHNKVLNIENGFDPDDFDATETYSKRNDATDKFVLSYLGTVYEGTADEFIQGLSIMKQKSPHIYSNLIVRFIGSQKKYITMLADTHNVSDVIEFLDYMPHKQSLSVLSKSNVLLILLGGNNFPSSEVPAKTFEYLYVKKPILAITKKGDLSNILEKSRLGVIVSPNNPDLVADELERLFHMVSDNIDTIEHNEVYINKFSREKLTERLVNVLNEVSGNAN